MSLPAPNDGRLPSIGLAIWLRGQHSFCRGTRSARSIIHAKRTVVSDVEWLRGTGRGKSNINAVDDLVGRWRPLAGYDAQSMTGIPSLSFTCHLTRNAS